MNYIILNIASNWCMRWTDSYSIALRWCNSQKRYRYSRRCSLDHTRERCLTIHQLWISREQEKTHRCLHQQNHTKRTAEDTEERFFWIVREERRLDQVPQSDEVKLHTLPLSPRGFPSLQAMAPQPPHPAVKRHWWVRTLWTGLPSSAEDLYSMPLRMILTRLAKWPSGNGVDLKTIDDPKILYNDRFREFEISK